jgi:lysophospholipase L1-like esterase
MQRHARRLMLLTLLLLLGNAIGANAGEEFPLQGGERILFFGDSITQGGAYVTDVELYLRTRFPSKTFTVINHGISSETISGTSEPDHVPRRPDAHDRFDRDVAAWNPDVVVACFGMNDGNYHPFDEARFRAYQAGVNKLIARVHESTKARLVLLTPPPFDPYRRQAGDPDAVRFGYKFPAIDYDKTLEHYANWLVTLRTDGRVVADLHEAMNDHLATRRRDRVSFYLAADAVHPNATGHLLMAQTLLQAWHAPALVSEAVIDAETRSSDSEDVEAIQTADGGLAARWTTRIPMPVDPDCDPLSLKVAKTTETLNRHRLAIRGLPPGRYALHVREEGQDDLNVGIWTADQIAEGLDLTALESFPTNRRAREVFRALSAQRAEEYASWRKQIASPTPATPKTLAEDDREAIRKLCRPMALQLHVTPVS